MGGQHGHGPNGNGNGRAPNAQLQGNGEIPIIGQPITIESHLIQVMFTCRCANPKTLLWIGVPGSGSGSATLCPSCRRLWSVVAEQQNPDGSKSFQFQFRTLPDAAPKASSEPAESPVEP